MKRLLAALFGLSFAAGLLAQGPPRPVLKAGSNLIYHGGPFLAVAKVVDIFWGPSFSNPASPDYAYAQTLLAYRNQLGTTPEYTVITQYFNGQISHLGAGTADWFDSSTPPTNVTDAIAQAEVQRYVLTHAVDASTVYELFLPSTSYSSVGGSTSCGGPSLAYCSYHGSFVSGGTAVKYSVQPYPSCSGCRVSGWSVVQNQEDFVCVETFDAVTDPQFNAWYDINGTEVANKCGPPILRSGSAACPVWSNAAHGCVQ